MGLSEDIPTSLPFDGKFDLIFAFSVFTHLSERATHASLSSLIKAICDRGVIVITIRPIEYWNLPLAFDEQRRNGAAAKHVRDGFSFLPHNLPPIDGDVTYGDTSMTLKYLESTFPS